MKKQTKAAMKRRVSRHRIRPFRPDDAAAIMRLTVEEFAPVSIDAKIEARLGGIPWTRIKENTVRKELAENPGGCFVAAVGGRVVGYVTTVVSDVASRGTIANLAVSADCQGKGIGRQLIQRAIDYFRDGGLRQAKIETLVCNKVGRHLYPSLGFREVTRQIHYAMSLSLALLLGVFTWDAHAAKSVSRFGITWTFEGDHAVGVYANGDPWVVGPVTITRIDPACTNVNGWIRNGTMVNPVPGTLRQDQGFDSSVKRFAWWNPALNVAPGFTGSPLAVAAGSSVVSAISRDAPNTNTSESQLSEAEVLTVVAAPPPAGSFRPPVVGNDKTHRWNKTDLNYRILRRLKPVPSTPPLATVEQYFERPWLAIKESSSVQSMSPLLNMPHYGRDQAQRLSLGLLSLHLDYTDAQKETLYIRLVQIGIDVYGSVKAGMIFEGNGGQNAGRKAPLVLAGLALHDTNILEWADAGKHFVFQEDRQTFYVQPADVGRVMYSDDKRPRETYRQEHVGMPEWGEQHTVNKARDASNWASAYYRWIGGAWQGNILAIKLIPGGEAAWNWPPVFAYADRYWSIEGASQTYSSPNAITPFVCEMWAAYRGTPLPAAAGK